MESRRVARFLVVDPSGRALLFRFARPSGEAFWATPGGGLEEGESFEEAAAREAAEELGMDPIPLVPLWDSRSEYLHEGRSVLLEARFFLLRVRGVEFTPSSSKPTGEIESSKPAGGVPWTSTPLGS